MPEIEVNIRIIAENEGSHITIYRKGHRKTRQIWLEKKSGGIIALRDRWFYSNGGWKDMGYEEFPKDGDTGLLKYEDATKTVVSMLATSGIDGSSSLVKFLEEEQ